MFNNSQAIPRSIDDIIASQNRRRIKEQNRRRRARRWEAIRETAADVTAFVVFTVSGLAMMLALGMMIGHNAGAL